jgi:hypothetical protein
MKILEAVVMTAMLAMVVSCSTSDSTPADDAANEASDTTTTPAETTEAAADRRDAAVATIDEIIAILNDPASFGTEEEVADLIATHAVPGAQMDDAVFGAVAYRTGFYNTLYRGAVDARIDVYHRAVSDDGSQGVILWMWHGTNVEGNPFELAGISLTDFDDQGRITYELVTYPYPDEYVENAVFGAGTPITVGVTTVSPRSWNPILRSTTASPTPAAAVCPIGTDPDEPGRSEPHPTGAPPANQDAVFDAATGRIVYLDGVGETWTFNVCSNTWMAMDADDEDWQFPVERRLDSGGELLSPPGNLVYDVDSNVTIALGRLGVYDAETNTWTRRNQPIGTMVGYRGAVYDPVSGLVITAGVMSDYLDDDGLGLFAYDVESDTWTSIGTIDADPPWVFLVGYSSAEDQLIFHGPDADDENRQGGSMTVLVDPRTGVATSIGDPEWDVFAPWGSWYPYAYGVDGAVIADTGRDRSRGTGDVCTFDPLTRSWDDCTIDTSGGPQRAADSASMVYDAVNDRLVVIYGDGDVWAVALGTGEWTALTTD